MNDKIRPRTLKIFGQKYFVKYNLRSKELNGLTDSNNNTIHLRSDLPEDKLFRIFMHEVTHAVIEETPLCTRKRFNIEEVCDMVGFHFIDTLKANPILVDWLIKEIKE